MFRGKQMRKIAMKIKQVSKSRKNILKNLI
jgi:hypothetical protein